MDSERYRYDIRNHFVDIIKDAKFKSSAQLYKEEVLRNRQKMHHCHNVCCTHHSQQKQSNRSAHGNFENDFSELSFAQKNNNDVYRQNEPNYVGDSISRVKTDLRSASKGKQPSEDSVPFLYKRDRNLCLDGDSDESIKSQKSSKSVTSKKSSRDLRNIMKSQCQLHDIITDTLNHVKIEDYDPEKPFDRQKKEQLKHLSPKKPIACEYCCKKKDAMTEIAKEDFCESPLTSSFTPSLDEVVNPMIQTLQSMCLRKLKEELSLIEDLEQLPEKINKVTKNVANFVRNRNGCSQ